MIYPLPSKLSIVLHITFIRVLMRIRSGFCIYDMQNMLDGPDPERFWKDLEEHS